MDNKTAIQELMEIVEMDANNGVEISMRVFYKMLQDALPKERQQIEQAYNQGYREAEIDNGADIRDDISDYQNASNYYNQTYTQNNNQLNN